MVNRWGFGSGTSMASVNAAVEAFRRFETLMVKLSAEEKAQVYEKTPMLDMSAWGKWE